MKVLRGAPGTCAIFLPSRHRWGADRQVGRPALPEVAAAGEEPNSEGSEPPRCPGCLGSRTETGGCGRGAGEDVGALPTRSVATNAPKTSRHSPSAIGCSASRGSGTSPAVGGLDYQQVGAQQLGFSAAVNASPKNAAFTGSVDSLGIAADAPNARRARIPDRDDPPLSSA
jgi:hypothetical protein